MPTTPIIPAVPVFPLDDYFVFPGSVTPLHVFETRYRQLMRDLMDSSGRFVIAPGDPSLARDPQGGGPALPGVGTLVEILRSEELDDGRWLVILLALARVGLVEVASDRLYRRADAQVLPEPEAGEAGPAEADLREPLVAALRLSADGFGFAAPDAVPTGRLADLLLHTLPLDAAQRRRAFTELDPAARAALALEWLTTA